MPAMTWKSLPERIINPHINSFIDNTSRLTGRWLILYIAALLLSNNLVRVQFSKVHSHHLCGTGRVFYEGVLFKQNTSDSDSITTAERAQFAVLPIERFMKILKTRMVLLQSDHRILL